MINLPIIHDGELTMGRCLWGIDDWEMTDGETSGYEQISRYRYQI
jgi:hypothetical protein